MAKTLQQLKEELEGIKAKNKAKGILSDAQQRRVLRLKILLAKHHKKVEVAKRIGRGFGIMGKGAYKVLEKVSESHERAKAQQRRGKGKRKRLPPSFF